MNGMEYFSGVGLSQKTGKGVLFGGSYFSVVGLSQKTGNEILFGELCPSVLGASSTKTGNDNFFEASLRLSKGGDVDCSASSQNTGNSRLGLFSLLESAMALGGFVGALKRESSKSDGF